MCGTPHKQDEGGKKAKNAPEPFINMPSSPRNSLEKNFWIEFRNQRYFSERIFPKR